MRTTRSTEEMMYNAYESLIFALWCARTPTGDSERDAYHQGVFTGVYAGLKLAGYYVDSWLAEYE